MKMEDLVGRHMLSGVDFCADPEDSGINIV